MPQYRFSPILDEQTFHAALDYLALQAPHLAKQVIGKALAIDTLCLFAHSGEEYDFLAKTISGYGPKSRLSHGVTLYVDSDFMVQGQRIVILGVRKADSSRFEVGYADYPVNDYQAIKVAGYPGAQEITSGRGRSLLELMHPEFDIRGYIVDMEDHYA